jgi:hypothetical protein
VRTAEPISEAKANSTCTSPRDCDLDPGRGRPRGSLRPRIRRSASSPVVLLHRLVGFGLGQPRTLGRARCSEPRLVIPVADQQRAAVPEVVVLGVGRTVELLGLASGGCARLRASLCRTRHDVEQSRRVDRDPRGSAVSQYMRRRFGWLIVIQPASSSFGERESGVGLYCESAPQKTGPSGRRAGAHLRPSQKPCASKSSADNACAYRLTTWRMLTVTVLNRLSRAVNHGQPVRAMG